MSNDARKLPATDEVTAQHEVPVEVTPVDAAPTEAANAEQTPVTEPRLPKPEVSTRPKPYSARRVVTVTALALVTLWLGSVIGPPLGRGLHHLSTAVRGESADEGDHAQYYTCGMHPWVILPKPGSCPICGMDLVPLDPSKFSGEVSIDPVVAQNIGVRLAEVKKGSSGGAIRTVGIVAYDETRLGDVNLKISGWVEKLDVDYLGTQVKKGQRLFSLYSPELYAAEEEYLLAWRAAKQTPGAGGLADGVAQKLLDAARTKLAYFDVSPAQIAELERRGAPVKTMAIYSPQAGVVTEKHVFEGQKVNAGHSAYRIADLSRVWVMATLYEYQSQQVKVGQSAKMSLSYAPGNVLEGKIVYVYPYLDERTRQLTVRLEFPNPDGALKPGMYATVELEGADDAPRVLVPRSAVIDTGARQVAFVAKGEGHFEPREVRMGGEVSGGDVEILSGLDQGERVVTSGQFLIDSEARMREALAKMMGGTSSAGDSKEAAPPEAAKPTVALPPAAAAALGAGLDGYLGAGDALASDTTRDIGVAARKLAEAMDVLTAIEVPGQPHFWHQHGEAMAVRDEALKLAAAANIDAARRSFSTLSAELAGLTRAVGVPAGYGKKLEEQHCPMFPDGSSGGSVWLQAAGPVRNPYFGSAMLTCSDRTAKLPASPGEDAR